MVLCDNYNTFYITQRYLFAAIGNGFRLYDVLAHEGIFACA